MPERVLVIEDMGVVAEAWARALSDHLGVVVDRALTEHDAMRFIAEGAYDAIVSGYYFSIEYPDDGFVRLLSAIRTKTKKIPVIFVAGYVRPQDSFAAAKLGAFDFVVLDKRTMDITVLVNTVRSALALHKIPQIFISYSSKDRIFSSTLATKLKEQGWQVWYDQWEINVGDSLIRKIEQGIVTSSYFLVVLSETSVVSRWVREELESAMLRQFDGDEVQILPVRIDDCAIPPFLRSKKYADFRYSFEEGVEQIIKTVTR